MTRLTPVSREELIRRLRVLGLPPPPRHVDNEVRVAHRESGRHRDVSRGRAAAATLGLTVFSQTLAATGERSASRMAEGTGRGRKRREGYR
jgi:hypothetical protein